MNRGFYTLDVALPQPLQQWVILLSQRHSDRLFLLWEGSYQSISHLQKKNSQGWKMDSLKVCVFVPWNTMFNQAKKCHHRYRRQFRDKAEQYILKDFLSIQETRERQKTAGPAESINTGRAHFWITRDLRDTKTPLTSVVRVTIHSHTTYLNVKIPVKCNTRSSWSCCLAAWYFLQWMESWSLTWSIQHKAHSSLKQTCSRNK